MSKRKYYTHHANSLDGAWSHVFLDMIGHGSPELSPFTLCIESKERLVPLTPTRSELAVGIDNCLAAMGEKYQNVEKIAFTIFPDRVWKLMGGDRSALYKEFLLDQPTYVSWCNRKNNHGLYFGRLIGYGVDHRTNKTRGVRSGSALSDEGNQLEHIITQCKRSIEDGVTAPRMQLQAAIFDPMRDATKTAQPSFPCLQHITFDPSASDGTLGLNAFYATQQLFIKAYGNWLGLCRLGDFVASQCGLTFNRFTCFAGVQKMNEAPKRGAELEMLISVAKESVAASHTAKQGVSLDVC